MALCITIEVISSSAVSSRETARFLVVAPSALPRDGLEIAR